MVSSSLCPSSFIEVLRLAASGDNYHYQGGLQRRLQRHLRGPQTQMKESDAAGRIPEVAGKSSKAARRAFEVTKRASKAIGRASEVAGEASEPAGRASKPVGKE